jgi:hypothetical protein
LGDAFDEMVRHHRHHVFGSMIGAVVVALVLFFYGQTERMRGGRGRGGDGALGGCRQLV